uniref:Uncharacterized protein n=1 Tax=Panagrolaimus sp. JU765 TaxID=591449 RepID=A0AC34QWV2_9BILA
MNVSRLDLPENLKEKLTEAVFAKAILTESALKNGKNEGNGANQEEPFVIELKQAESLENLIVEPSNFTSKTSEFMFFRNELVKPLKMKGCQILQNLTKKYKEETQRSKFRKVMSEIPTNCCCHKKTMMKCFQCKNSPIFKQIQAILTESALKNGENQGNGANQEEPFVIELKQAESLENLIVEPSNFTSKTSEFMFFRNELVKPLKLKGSHILQNLTKKYKEETQRSKFRKVMSEIPTNCCCHKKTMMKCFQCKNSPIFKQIQVFYENSSLDSTTTSTIDENKICLNFTESNLSNHKVSDSLSKLFDAKNNGDAENSNFHLPICDECFRFLALFYLSKKHEKELENVEKIPMMNLYNELFAEWSMLKHFCEKHLALSRQMMRNRNYEIENAFGRSKADFARQRTRVREIGDKLNYYGELSPNTQLGTLEISISAFAWKSCALMQEKISRANDEVSQFLMMEKKVMKTKNFTNPLNEMKFLTSKLEPPFKKDETKTISTKMVEATVNLLNSWFKW